MNDPKLSTTVNAYLVRAEFVRQESGGRNLAKAYIVLSDHADEHEFKVAVPREFAKTLGEYLAGWDESSEPPDIEVTFTIPESEP